FRFPLCILHDTPCVAQKSLESCRNRNESSLVCDINQNSLPRLNSDIGKFHVSIANPSLDKAQKITLNFDELKPSSVSGEILKSKKITDHNEFDKAPAVAPVAFNGYKLAKGTITVEVPAASVIVLEIR
ncbi:MAG: hypothetical protein II637_04615, partial [Bacteroidales bacterium]|nr:hypothetical protein [Bacteroidales bacterium]